MFASFPYGGECFGGGLLAATGPSGVTHESATLCWSGALAAPVSTLTARAFMEAQGDALVRSQAAVVLHAGGAGVGCVGQDIIRIAAANVVGASAQLISVDCDVAEAAVIFTAFASLDGVAAFSALAGTAAQPQFPGLNWRLDQPDPVQAFHLTIGADSTHFRII